MTSQNHDNGHELPAEEDAISDEPNRLDQIGDAFPECFDGQWAGRDGPPISAANSKTGSSLVHGRDPGHEAAVGYALKVASGEESLPPGTKLQTGRILAKLCQAFALEKLEALAQRGGPNRDSILGLFHAIDAIDRPDLTPFPFLELKQQIDRLEQQWDRPDDMHIELDRTYALARQIPRD